MKEEERVRIHDCPLRERGESREFEGVGGESVLKPRSTMAVKNGEEADEPACTWL